MYYANAQNKNFICLYCTANQWKYHMTDKLYSSTLEYCTRVLLYVGTSTGVQSRT